MTKYEVLFKMDHSISCDECGKPAVRGHRVANESGNYDDYAYCTSHDPGDEGDEDNWDVVQEWKERENNAFAALGGVDVEDVDTQERGKEVVSIYTVIAHNPSAFEQAMNSHDDCISFREVGKS